ncbi:DIC protein, partial [Crypturellus soui]|nr:DIC protein [Crypturellus soui]
GAAGAPPEPGRPQEEEAEMAPVKAEKLLFTVRLTELKAADKVKLIKEVKNFVPGVNLVQAKKLVESLPQEIKANAPKEEAEKIKAALEAAGGTVDCRPRGPSAGPCALAHGGRQGSCCWEPSWVLPAAGGTEGTAGGQGLPTGSCSHSWRELLCKKPGPRPGRKEAPRCSRAGFTSRGWAHPCVSAEGLKKLFSGATMASSRGALVTVGQLSCYDQAKQLVLTTGLLSDNIFTHFLASFIAGGCATFLCQPLDVLKTRLMNSQGEYRGVSHCALETAKLGPLAFYKGFVPAAIRLVPHTVLTFVFLEQLRKYFGIKVIT